MAFLLVIVSLLAIAGIAVLTVGYVDARYGFHFKGPEGEGLALFPVFAVVIGAFSAIFVGPNGAVWAYPAIAFAIPALFLVAIFGTAVGYHKITSMGRRQRDADE